MFDFDGDHATTVRPPHKAAATPNNWAKDPSGPGANDGTRITASLINSIVGNLRHLLDAYNISLPGSSDDAVKLAIEAAIQQALENHTFSVAELEDGDGYVRMTEAERAKLASLAANYKGAFADLAAVAAAYPAAAAGDWAIIMKPGEPAAVAVWDADTEEWVDSAGSPPQTASQVPFTPSGNLEATNVQAALEELDAEKADGAATSAALAARLRVDTAQALTTGEIAQARRNLLLPDAGPTAGFRNAAINGSFEVWQRGTAATSSAAGARTALADRWYVNPTGNAVSQERATSVPSDGRTRYSLQVTGDAGVTTCLIGTRIEASAMPGLARGEVTFSFRIYNGTGAAFTPSLLLGTPSAEDNFTTTTNRLTQALQECADGQWTTVQHTADISGFADILNGLQVELEFPSGSLDSNAKLVRVTEIQIEPGGVKTPFEARPKAVEEGICQRYAEGGNVTIGNYGQFNITEYIRFNVAKRALPMLTFSNVSDVTGTFNGPPGTFAVSAGGFSLTRPWPDSPAYARYSLNWFADAELF